MKRIFIFILSFLLWQSASSQRNIWQFDFDTETVNVRTDTAYVMQKVTVDIPSKGTAIVKMEGVVTGSTGDNIILAISNYQTWLTNYGNVSYYFVDSMDSRQQFNHLMVYNVEQGTSDFYALMHNWTDREGTGFASAKGKMIIEFIPEQEEFPNVLTKKRTQYPMILTPTPTILDSLVIHCDQNTAFHFGAFVRIGSLQDQDLEVSLQYSNENNTKYFTIPCPTNVTDESKQFNISEIKSFGPGEHTIYLTARKLSGNFTSQNNGAYYTLYAEPLIQEGNDMPYFSETFSENALNLGQTKLLKNITWEATEDGQLFIMTDGYWNGAIGDRIQLELNQGSEKLSSSISYCNDITESTTHFTLNHVAAVKKGQNIPLHFTAQFSGTPSSTEPNSIGGNIKGFFISEPITSSSDQVNSQPQTWKVYPNPASGIMNVSHDLPAGHPFSMMLVTASGEMAFQEKEITSNSTLVDVSTLTPGVHALYVTYQQVTTLIKVVVLP